jgi:uncharacterized protein (DUF305 family)
MNPQLRLLAPIAVMLGAIGFGSLAIANLTTQQRSNSTLAQNSDGMNHGGMNHDGMKKGGMMNHNMDVGPADANYDLRFLDSMIPHHQGALVMAQDVLKKSKRPELVKLAKSIITDQKKEIDRMKQWRKQWYPKASSQPIMWHTEMKHEMVMTAEHKQSMMMSMSLGKADAGFDIRFLDAMIPHHQGAVTMGQDLLLKSKRPQMKKLAQNIIKSQQVEIDMMTQWQQAWSVTK